MNSSAFAGDNSLQWCIPPYCVAFTGVYRLLDWIERCSPENIRERFTIIATYKGLLTLSRGHQKSVDKCYKF